MRVPVIIQALLFIFILDALITFSIGAAVWWLLHRPPVLRFAQEVVEEMIEAERKEKERRGLC